MLSKQSSSSLSIVLQQLLQRAGIESFVPAVDGRPMKRPAFQLVLGNLETDVEGKDGERNVVIRRRSSFLSFSWNKHCQ